MFASACSATWVPWGNAHLHMFQRLGCPILCSCDIRRFRRLDIAVRKNWESHIDASHSRQPLVKGERLVRYEVNAVIPGGDSERNGPDHTREFRARLLPDTSKRAQHADSGCARHLIKFRGCWAEARIKITRMTLTIKLDRNWNSFQLANSAPPLSVTGSAIAPSARMSEKGWL